MKLILNKHFNNNAKAIDFENLANYEWLYFSLS